MREITSQQKVREVVEKYGGVCEKLVQILLELQEISGQNFISKEVALTVAEEMGLPLSKVYDVITFYSMFSVEPKGRHIIEVCKSAPCHVNRPQSVVNMFESALGIRMGETTPDKTFTLQHSSCFGACDISPAIKIGDEIYGNLTEDKVLEIINSYREGYRNVNRS